jgi:CHAD domain-containing protein
VPCNAEHLDALHDVRKECQRLALQIRLISRLGPRKRMESLARELGRVVSDIGSDRDLGLLEGLLVERRAEFPDPSQVDAMLLEVRRRRGKLLRAARRRASEVLRPKSGEIRALVSRGK